MQSGTKDFAQIADDVVSWWDSHWRSVAYSFLAGMLFAFVLAGCSAAYAADYAKPPNAPEIFVDAHGVTVGVWAVQTGVGHGIGVFEKSGTGPWTLCGQCLVDPAYPTLDAAVANAGGPGPYVASKLDRINAVLAQRYPSVVSEPTTTIEKVNGVLANHVLRLVNGSPQIGPR